MGEHARAVRSLPNGTGSTGARQLLIIVLLVAVAFGTALYLGVRPSYQAPSGKRAAPLRITLIPLAPQGVVPGGTPADLYGSSPARQFRIGASGINFPAAQRTKNFSQSQVMTALTIAKDYLVESSLDPDVLTGGAVRPVRVLLDPDQLDQFDRSIANPVADGQHAATGWLIRYDPATVALADPEIRVRGTLAVSDGGADTLEVMSDHTFAYALRPVLTHGPPTGPETAMGLDTGAGGRLASAAPGDPRGSINGPGETAAPGESGVMTGLSRTLASQRAKGESNLPGGERDQTDRGTSRAEGASLFTVRRVLHFRFDRDDLNAHRTELLTSYVQAGPQTCSDDAAGVLRPLLAGQRAAVGVPAGTDPYAQGDPTAALCGALAPSAQPSP